MFSMLSLHNNTVFLPESGMLNSINVILIIVPGDTEMSHEQESSAGP